MQMKMHYVGKLLFEIILSVCALKLREQKWAISGKKSCKQTSRTKRKLFFFVLRFLYFVIDQGVHAHSCITGNQSKMAGNEKICILIQSQLILPEFILMMLSL